MSPFAHEIGELKIQTDHYDRQAYGRQPRIQRKEDGKHHRHRGRYIHQVRDGMGDEPLYLFDVLVHRFLDGPGGRVVQIPQRKPADVFGQADSQPIEYAESCHVRGHQGGIQQYQSAGKPAKRYPAPAYHDGPVRSGGISSMRQQFFQNLINRPIGHQHAYGASRR